MDQGLACLLVICKFYNVAVDADAVSHEHDPGGRGMDGPALVRALRKLHFRARLAKMKWNRLLHMPCPAICRTRDGRYVIIARHGTVPGRDGSVTLLHWPDGRQETLGLDALRELLSGEVVLLTPRGGAGDRDALRFDLSWFVPMLVKHRWRVFELLVASFLIQVLGLATPIGFQVVMDKVITHRAFATLGTVVWGLVMAVVLEGALSVLRDYLTAHLGCRMDARLGASVFRRLVRQPLAFFSERQVGEIVQRVREVEAVRGVFGERDGQRGAGLHVRGRIPVGDVVLQPVLDQGCARQPVVLLRGGLGAGLSDKEQGEAAV